tara:strand:- start:145 stop:1014 length:870 start_codon:yes stop_codon:yes gene_type:complete
MTDTCLIWLVNKIDKICKPTGEKRIIMTMESVKNVTKYIKLPVILFHEDMTEKIKSDFLNIYDDITFFKLGDFKENNIPYDSNVCKCGKGYMMMCRFFSGVMQDTNILKQYDSYIRFDDDSFLTEPYINVYNFFEIARKNHYVYRSIFYDNPENINQTNGLFDFTYNFCINNNLKIDELLPSLKKSGFVSNGRYTGICPYNNFHFCKLELWHHPVIKDYTNTIIRNNYITLYNWMDANIHSMIIFVLCPLLDMKVSCINDFGYRHNKHFSVLGGDSVVFKDKEEFYPKC